MACSLCRNHHHNARSCPETVKCSLCNTRGHNRRTCPNKIRCGICTRPGHNARGCPGREEFNPAPILKEFPLPSGPRLSELKSSCGWFSDEILRINNEERESFERALKTLPTYENFRSAFKRLVDTVHKASGFRLYVGRSGDNSQLILNRFRYHFDNRNAFHLQPVFRVRTTTMRIHRWEELSIRWVRSKHELGVLCCNNDIPNDCGPWPSTENSIIYIAAGYW